MSGRNGRNAIHAPERVKIEEVFAVPQMSRINRRNIMELMPSVKEEKVYPPKQVVYQEVFAVPQIATNMMTVKQLKEELRTYQCKQTGNKKVIRDRLRSYRRKNFGWHEFYIA